MSTWRCKRKYTSKTQNKAYIKGTWKRDQCTWFTQSLGYVHQTVMPCIIHSNTKSYNFATIPCCHIFCWLIPWFSNISYNPTIRLAILPILHAKSCHIFTTIEFSCADHLQLHIVITIEVTHACWLILWALVR